MSVADDCTRPGVYERAARLLGAECLPYPIEFASTTNLTPQR